MEDKYLTTHQGGPIIDNQNSLTVGERGPVVLQDMHLIEKLGYFDRERIPERVVHAKGAGAHGYFQVYKSMAQYTCANFLQDPTKKTPVFVRFSLVVGARGSADTVRDARGFAVKFYTEEGNYDLVGNNLPVFFLRDARKFPDMVHAFKPALDSNISTNLSAINRFWDFISLAPESTHMIIWLFSDRGIPKSYRMMEGFGVNTFRWVTKEGRATYVKYHWKPKLGVHNLGSHEATNLAGMDPDNLTLDLWDTIASGEEVEYELFVQLMDIVDEGRQNIDPLDPTKTWPEDKFPLTPVGKMALNRNPKNYFVEVEQAAFSPATTVPGIELSADKLLQGRVFAYNDTQLYRLGTDYLQLPTNRPQEVLNTYYETNRLAGGKSEETPADPASMDRVAGEGTSQKIDPANDFEQAGEKYRSMSTMERDHLIDNIIDSLGKADKPIQERMVGYFTEADPKLGMRVAKGVGL